MSGGFHVETLHSSPSSYIHVKFWQTCWVKFNNAGGDLMKTHMLLHLLETGWRVQWSCFMVNIFTQSEFNIHMVINIKTLTPSPFLWKWNEDKLRVHPISYFSMLLRKREHFLGATENLIINTINRAHKLNGFLQTTGLLNLLMTILCLQIEYPNRRSQNPYFW